MLNLGAHASISSGYLKALEKVQLIGGNCLQIFSSSPVRWQNAKINDIQIKEFINLKNKLVIDPIYFHASYLINLANDGSIGHLSKQSLISEMNLAEKMKIKGSIIHLGSFKNIETVETTRRVVSTKYDLLIKNIKSILTNTPKNTLFIIENSGNHKIGQTLEEIGLIIKELNDKRMRVCLDTCHLFSTGYSWKTDQELNNFLDQFDELIGLDKLELWHVNDSRDAFSSFHDRHANIGEGTIGLEEFTILLNHPRTKNYPFIIETPGFDNKGPDKKNLDILKKIVET